MFLICPPRYVTVLAAPVQKVCGNRLYAPPPPPPPPWPLLHSVSPPLPLSLHHPLHLQMGLLYRLLHRLPHVVCFFLSEYAFPLTMVHANFQLSASGQHIGGDLLFPVRIGFSGTPSNLLPLELGECQYAQGDDGLMLHVLTHPDVVGYKVLEEHWSVERILQLVATAEPPHSALIDTGALITGLDNLQVCPACRSCSRRCAHVCPRALTSSGHSCTVAFTANRRSPGGFLGDKFFF